MLKGILIEKFSRVRLLLPLVNVLACVLLHGGSAIVKNKRQRRQKKLPEIREIHKLGK